MDAIVYPGIKAVVAEYATGQYGEILLKEGCGL